MEITTSITLDLATPSFPPQVSAVQYDSDTRYVAITITDNGSPWTIPTGVIGIVNIEKPDGTVCFYEYDADNNPAVTFAGNVATCLLVPQALTVPGEAYCDLSLYNADSQKITTFYFRLAIQPAAVPDDTITSTNYYNILTQEIAAALGAAAFAATGDVAMQTRAVLAPMLIAAVGILLSIVGIFLVRTKEGASMRQLLRSLGVGVNVSSLLIAVATFVILYLLDIQNWLGLSFSVITGLVAGIIIGQATEYYTSHSYKPTQKIARSGQTGPATVIISGIGVGMISTAVPVITIGVAIILAYLCAIGFDLQHLMTAQSMSLGLYGIGIAAVGMLSTLGITLATDAYGPIADNAGGNAEMSGLGSEVRRRTDALDALGNTTAATGKGFAIGSAALTALALLASYIEEIKVGLAHIGQTVITLPNGIERLVQEASIIDFMEFYQINLMNPLVLIGIFIGAMMSFLFCGLTMNAVGRAAESMVNEVRRQFREIKGILTGEATPDYARCVEISTRGAQREMLFPSLLAIIVPVLVGILFGVAGVMGLLVGGLSAGFVLAVFMANSGGAWDNAKKMIEEGNFGGKGSDCHKATVVGDTVGDPFKDTSGPSLNILIKLMSMVSIVMAGLTVAWHIF